MEPVRRQPRLVDELPAVVAYVAASLLRPYAASIAIGGVLDFEGRAGGDNTYSDYGIPKDSLRKHILISNANNSQQLTVKAFNSQSAAWTICGYVQPNSTLPIETCAKLRVENPATNTAAVLVGVAEIFPS